MSLVHGKNDLWDDLPLRKVTIRDMSYIVRTLYIGPPWKRMTWIAHQVKFNDSIVHEPGDPNLYPTLDRPLFTKKSWVSIGQCFKEHEVIDAVHDSSAIPGVVRLQCWDRTDNRTTPVRCCFSPPREVPTGHITAKWVFFSPAVPDNDLRCHGRFVIQQSSCCRSVNCILVSCFLYCHRGMLHCDIGENNILCNPINGSDNGNGDADLSPRFIDHVLDSKKPKYVFRTDHILNWG